jgi:hypothetical protein
MSGNRVTIDSLSSMFNDDSISEGSRATGFGEEEAPAPFHGRPRRAITDLIEPA